MSVQKSDEFISDVERQFEWYVIKAGWDIAHRYPQPGTAAPRGQSQSARR